MTRPRNPGWRYIIPGGAGRRRIVIFRLLAREKGGRGKRDGAAGVAARNKDFPGKAGRGMTYGFQRVGHGERRGPFTRGRMRGRKLRRRKPGKTGKNREKTAREGAFPRFFLFNFRRRHPALRSASAALRFPSFSLQDPVLGLFFFAVGRCSPFIAGPPPYSVFPLFLFPACRSVFLF